MIPKKLSNVLFIKEQSLAGKKEIFTRLDYLNKTQYYDYEELKKLQWEKLKKLLEHAYETVPYYQKLFKKLKIKVSDIKTYEDFLKIPILTKQDILDHNDELISNKFDKSELKKTSSSGSTGQPLTIYHTKEFKTWSKAHQLRNYNWCGDYEIGDNFVLLWGTEIYFKTKTLVDKFENFLMNRKEFNTFTLNEKQLTKYCRTMSRFKPVLISSYPSSLLFMAEIMKKYNIKINPKAIQTTSETLTQEDRKKIEKSFNCKVMDKYGSRETNVISCECEEQNGMHINVENVFVEFIRDGKPVKPGEVGEVIVTNLNEYGMPLLRYSIGDLGTPLDHKCKCGRNLPLMKQLTGRKADVIVNSNGDFIDSYFFSYLLQNFPDVKYFQIIQNTLDQIDINLVVKKEANKEFIESEVKRKIEKFLGDSLDIKFNYYDKIITEKNGKRRIVISKIPFDWSNFVNKKK